MDQDNLNEIKLTYIIITIVMLFFIGFIIFVVLMYNRKQLLYLKERQLNEAEHQNQLLQKELEKQRMIEQERERISHDMHDDLGAGISALKLQAEFLKQKANDGELKNDIDELLKTSEEMNLSMREMLWSLNSGNDTLESFINYSGIYARNFLRKTNIQLSIKDENIIPETTISTDQRRNLLLCLKETLNNAYKHSNADQLKISFKQIDNLFIMNVHDNGIGIGQDKSDGNGLRNMKKRMEQQNGNFEIKAESGTQISFSLPLK